MLESFGIQQALRRTSAVAVSLDGVAGSVNRPNLLGGLVSKAAALRNVGDSAERHLEDFLILCALLTASDLQAGLTQRDRQHISNALGKLERTGRIPSATKPQQRGVSLMRAALSR